METYQTLRALHGAAVGVFFLAILALAFYGWRSWRRGDAGQQAVALKRIGLLGWLLVAGSVLSLPVSGWNLVHQAGFPLGQTWLLGSACLLLVAAIFWLLFTRRLWRVRHSVLAAHASGAALASQATRDLRFGLGFFGVALLCVLVILGLMIGKPL
ncbi:MAG: hypothetical protein GAK45_01566 [Pseudomonas citronellolis]|nr:MAG: hypothetical protein GAK45_01566 [Pseudomonas citronellolis]